MYVFLFAYACVYLYLCICFCLDVYLYLHLCMCVFVSVRACVRVCVESNGQEGREPMPHGPESFGIHSPCQ